MSLTLRFAAGSHTGMIREHNEDSGYAGPRLLAIADGMGGQAAGEVASSEVISTLVQLDDDIPGSDLLTALNASVQHANTRLRAMVEEDSQLDGMGTTLTAMLWTGQRLGLVHVGDSRAYLLREGVLTQITQDHTWVQRLVDEGRITEEEATTHPQRSLLMRALGSADSVEADLSIREVRAGDRYLVCSDGLSGVVSHETMEHTLGAFAPPQETIRELIELALRGGGPDNITCIIADVLDVGHAPGDTETSVYSDAPQIVGAVAETQPHIGGPVSQTPASRAAELGRSRNGGEKEGGADDGNGVIGSFGSFTDDEYLPRRSGWRWFRRIAVTVLVLALLGAAAYGIYRWTQSQYYVAANDEHVAIFQGVSQDLGPLSLNEVHEDHPDIRLVDLPAFQRSEVEKAITTGGLAEARSKIEELANQAEACRLQAEREAALVEADDTDSEASDIPTLTDTQQRLARQCTS